MANAAVVTHLSTSQRVSGQLDLGEVALADRLGKPVVANVWLLLLGSGSRAATRRQAVAAGRLDGRDHGLGDHIRGLDLETEQLELTTSDLVDAKMAPPAVPVKNYNMRGLGSKQELESGHQASKGRCSRTHKNKTYHHYCFV